MKRKCYIAGKIGDLKESVYKANFEQAEREVIEMGFEPINPVKLPHDHGKTWREYMNEDLIEMLKCDHVYAQNNWIYSRGAKIELDLAAALGMNLIFQK